MPDGDNHEPATRQDINLLRTEISEVKTELKAEINELRADILNLAQRLERHETAMLTGFMRYARQQTTRTTSLESRVSDIEQRLLDIEEQFAKRQ